MKLDQQIFRIQLIPKSNLIIQMEFKNEARNDAKESTVN